MIQQAHLPIYRSKTDTNDVIGTLKISHSTFGANDALWQPLEHVSCFAVSIINKSGVSIQVRRTNSDVYVEMANSVVYVFDGIKFASEIVWRQAGFNGTKVSVNMIYDVKQ